MRALNLIASKFAKVPCGRKVKGFYGIICPFLNGSLRKGLDLQPWIYSFFF
jgi:hypothetical protein